ncbi:(Fe-S)-binding protein [Occallatibacter savannae]|uniref:(Fe-S)-binding protein n=1 Tax=Occallatibacter savannae TaxID=1002691 RepID=UPI001EF5FE6F|nr:(Fe-S)-binding protein [Occallatibacter savannae]
MNFLSSTLAEPQSFQTWEKLLLLALILLSAAIFLRRFAPILGRILHSKKDPNFTLAPVGKRSWDFFWEVICQAKVIRERPLPGLAHAFVFWGFCAFALVTLNHFAVGFGLGFLDPVGFFGRSYSYLAAAFAAACAIGIFGLFVRRFFVRPRWLGRKVSYESGFIAALIFILMVTYLAAFAVRSASPAATALWWIHALSILVFLPIIPHTKHLHLVLSPATIFLSRGGFSKIPPLVGDEDFGLVTGKDLTQLTSLQAYSCVECGRCTEHCPANNTGKELNPKQIILGLRGYLNEHGPASEQNIIGTYNSITADFQCTTCGACEYQCPVGIEHLPIIIGLRRGAVNTGMWEDEHGAKLFLALERGSNALGMPASDRDKFIQKQQFPVFDGSQEYCLWLGCMGGYDPKGREIIADFARVMNYLGASYGVLRKEKCTGDPVRRLGNDLLFQQLAESNLETLAQNKVKKIVTICPHCVRTIQEDWKEFGTPPAIEHHSEFLARFADKLPRPNQNVRVPQVSIPGNQNLTAEQEARVPQVSTLRPGNENSAVEQEASGHDFSRAENSPNPDRALAPANNKIVFHDPCYLGRYRDVYEEPRAVASLAGEVVEAPRSHQRSFCCGAGGGLVFLGEETGDRVSHTRVNELIATGASTIGTACPFCNSMFRDALAEKGDAAPQLLDIAQLTARNLPPANQQ